MAVYRKWNFVLVDFGCRVQQTCDIVHFLNSSFIINIGK